MGVLEDIQLALNTVVDGFVTLPDGVIDIPLGFGFTTPSNVPRRIFLRTMNGTKFRTVDANGNILRVPQTKPLFDFSYPDYSEVEVLPGIDVDGPVSDDWDPNLEGTSAVYRWELARRLNTRMRVRGGVITGSYGTAIRKAGGGRLDVEDMYMEAWVNPVAFFESHGGTAPGERRFTLRDSHLAAPTRSKYSSIGAYVHPHIQTSISRVLFQGWNRYALYMNGSMDGTGYHDMNDVVADGCALVQSNGSALMSLQRCLETGTVNNGGSQFRGPVQANNCVWETSNGMIGFLSNTAVKREFVNNVINTGGTWLACGNNVLGEIEVVGSTFDLSRNGSNYKTVPLSKVQNKFVSCKFQGTSTDNFVVNIEGGSLRLVDTVLPPNSRALAPGVIVTG